MIKKLSKNTIKNQNKKGRIFYKRKEISIIITFIKKDNICENT